MKIVKGDLLALASQGEFDVIIHGCNCFCTMGAGIAKFIKAKFPEAFEADKNTEKGSREKLGSYSHAVVTTEFGELIVVNGYTQHNYRGRKPLLEYDALESVFRKVAADFSGKRIGYPRIGAGLAGGDWAKIAAIIEKELSGEDHTLVEFQ